MSGMPCGECCVCEDDIDHADAGFCVACGGAFHWSGCGGWARYDGFREHVCNTCQNQGEEE